MNETLAHYDTLLAKHYTWAFGGQAANVQRNRDFFDELDLTPSGTGVALDLGAGSGFYAVPLLERGFSVFAVDCCQFLLNETQAQWPGAELTTIEADARDLTTLNCGSVQVVLCMGDTLSHFDSLDDVDKLLSDARDILVENGRVILSFRDLSEPLVGTARFIPVQSDDDRILTCFLEYMDNTVRVHDILHERQGEEWKLSASAYDKIVIPKPWLVSKLGSIGYTVSHNFVRRGMHTIVANR